MGSGKQPHGKARITRGPDVSSMGDFAEQYGDTPTPPGPPAKASLGDFWTTLDNPARVAALVTVIGAIFGGVAEVVRIVTG